MAVIATRPVARFLSRPPPRFHPTKAQRLVIIICISASFFVAEISVGFYTKSLALIADAFHYLNDLIGFVVALVALKVSQRQDSPDALSFGWQRAQMLAAFFNGVFLFALGISIFLQALERFVVLQHVDHPEMVIVVGGVGLGLNIICGLFLHEHDHGHSHDHHSYGEEEKAVGSCEHSSESSIDVHDHDHDVADNIKSEEKHVHESPAKTDMDTLLNVPRASTSHAQHRHVVSFANAQKHSSHDLNMLAALLHVVGDAINNIGVMITGVVIWKAKFEGRYYADPGVSMAIALLIIGTAWPVIKNSGAILLESCPPGLSLADIRHDIEAVPSISAIHELHIWRLDQKVVLASMHVITTETTIQGFMQRAKMIVECLHAYGIHSVTLQPELAGQGRKMEDARRASVEGSGHGVRQRHAETGTGQKEAEKCRIGCGLNCEELTCCGGQS